MPLKSLPVNPISHCISKNLPWRHIIHREMQKILLMLGWSQLRVETGNFLLEVHKPQWMLLMLCVIYNAALDDIGVFHYVYPKGADNFDFIKHVGNTYIQPSMKYSAC